MRPTGIGSRPSRRRLLQGLGAGAGVWAAGQVVGSPRFGLLDGDHAAASSGPDVYVVTLDDCPPEYIGYYQSRIPTAYQGPIFTPEIDALMAASWTATSARATTANCAASRSALLTGSSAARTGIFGEEGTQVGQALAGFLAKVTSGQLVALPGFLTAQGLDTAARGKVDHTGELFGLAGQIGEQGIHTAIGPLYNDPDYSPFNIFGPDSSFLPYASLPASVTHVDTMRTDEQIARINSPAGGPRVDFLGFAMPHTPRAVHQSWIDLYDLDEIELRTTPAEVASDIADIPATHLADLEPPYLYGLPRAEWMNANLTEVQLKEHIRHMLATISHTSFQIGRLKSALDAAGRPYVIVLTSDHGYHLGEKGRYAKGTLYDKALRVPLAIYSSEGSAEYPVGDVSHPIGLDGLAKTVAQLAGVPDHLIPSAWGGRRFDDTAAGCTVHTWGADAATQSVALVFRSTASGTDFKLINHPGDAGELYDLTADPGEIDNLLVPGDAADGTGAGGGAREARLAEAEAELRLRARRQRAAEWLAGGGRPTDAQHG